MQKIDVVISGAAAGVVHSRGEANFVADDRTSMVDKNPAPDASPALVPTDFKTFQSSP